MADANLSTTLGPLTTADAQVFEELGISAQAANTVATWGKSTMRSETVRDRKRRKARGLAAEMPSAGPRRWNENHVSSHDSTPTAGSSTQLGSKPAREFVVVGKHTSFCGKKRRFLIRERQKDALRLYATTRAGKRKISNVGVGTLELSHFPAWLSLEQLYGLQRNLPNIERLDDEVRRNLCIRFLRKLRKTVEPSVLQKVKDELAKLHRTTCTSTEEERLANAECEKKLILLLKESYPLLLMEMARII